MKGGLSLHRALGDTLHHPALGEQVGDNRERHRHQVRRERDVVGLEAGDAGAQLVADAVGQRLGRVVATLGNMFDPSRVVLCGAIADGIEPVIARAQRTARSILHLPAPEIVRSQLGADIVLTGAIATALHSAREIALPELAQGRLRERSTR